MTTLADLIAECRNDYLMTGGRDARNLLAGTVATTDATFTFTYDLGPIDNGAKLSVGLEDSHVWAANPSAKSAMVSRGDFGSTAAAHTSGAVVLVNARFTDAQILRAINHELAALSSPSNRLFQVLTVDATYNAAIDGYDLTSVTDVLDVMDVRYQAVGPEQEWPSISRGLWEHTRNLDTSVFPSGQALFIRGYVDPGRTVRVFYRAPYSNLAAYTDDVEYVSGLHAQAHDILALGAAIRLTAGREIHRNFDETQGDTRRSQEVPAGANLGANRGLIQQYMKRVSEERSRLALMYPTLVR